MPKEKKEDTGRPKKPDNAYFLFCRWMRSDLGGVQMVHDSGTGKLVPLKDLSSAKQSKWFAGCYKGALAFPEGGITIGGLKFKTLTAMNAHFTAKAYALLEQWHTKTWRRGASRTPRPRRQSPPQALGTRDRRIRSRRWMDPAHPSLTLRLVPQARGTRPRARSRRWMGPRHELSCGHKPPSRQPKLLW